MYIYPPAPLRGPEAAKSGIQHAAASHITKCSSGAGLKFATLKFAAGWLLSPREEPLAQTGSFPPKRCCVSVWANFDSELAIVVTKSPRLACTFGP